MTEHTPGIWHYERGQILTEADCVLARIPYTCGDRTDAANGRLMAAAPELLAVCEMLLAGRVNMDGARVAVARARKG